MKESNGEEINKVDMEGVLTLLDKCMKGESITELPKFNEGSESSKFDNGEDVAQSHVHMHNNAKQQQAKMLMEDEMKRISATYSEEKQKLDLAMKIEQARQRATLQRKLLAKKQQQEQKGKSKGGNISVNLGAMNSRLGSGYPGNENANAVHTVEEANQSQENSGAFRMPSNLGPMIPTGITRGISMRGMNLQPLLKK